MEYGKLIHDAWAITWRYRFLWILGVLAGGTVGVPALNGGGGGSGTGIRVGQTGDAQLDSELARVAQDASAWAAANIGLLIALAAVATVFVLALIVLSFIAQGGMAEATTDLATGQPSSFSRAWTAGIHLFWRYVGLWLVLAAVALVVAATIAVVVATAIVAATVGQAPVAGFAIATAVVAAVVVGFVLFIVRLIPQSAAPRWLVVLLATLFALPVFTVLIAAALTLSIVVAFAQRAIVVENVGPVAALRSGWRLMRAHLGESLLTWLVNVGLALVGGIIGVAGVLGTLVVLAGVGALVFAAAGLTAPMLGYIGGGALVFLAGVLTLVGIANTFFWAYWTLAYLQLTGRVAPAVG
jgi:hypothetical protein